MGARAGDEAPNLPRPPPLGGSGVGLGGAEAPRFLTTGQSKSSAQAPRKQQKINTCASWFGCWEVARCWFSCGTVMLPGQAIPRVGTGPSKKEISGAARRESASSQGRQRAHSLFFRLAAYFSHMGLSG